MHEDEVSILSHYSARRRSLPVSCIYSNKRLDSVFPCHRIRNQLQYYAMALAHLPGLQHRYAPSCPRARDNVRHLRWSDRLPATGRPPAMGPLGGSVRRQAQIAHAAVVLYAEPGDLTVYLTDDGILYCCDAMSHFFSTTNNVECAPGQQACDWIQVGSVYIAANPCCLKRNGASTAEWITNSRPLAEASGAKLFNQG